MANWAAAMRVEHEVARIIVQQEINGVLFDKPKALEYLDFLDNEMGNLYKQVRPYLRPEIIRDRKPVLNPFKKDGELLKRVIDYYGTDAHCVAGPYSPVLIEQPDLGKRQKLVATLLEHGWEPDPDEYTEPSATYPEGQPKLTVKGEPVESLLRLTGGIGAPIARWYILSHRRSVIKGWLERIRPDGRITAAANPCGANTHRMHHKTVVNVPKANADKEGNLIWDINQQKNIFGTQMRSLFTVPDNKVMVGHDASGLELRLLAHYMNDPDFTKELLNGDIHTFNQNMAGLPTRDDAKTFIYAFIYGAGDAKIGSIVGGTAADGRELKRRFLRNLSRLGGLIEGVQRDARRGFLIGLDGRKLYIRGEHAALNVLLQGAGAIVMKYSMVFLDHWVRKHGLDVLKLIDMHDEAQAEVLPDHAELYSKMAVKSIRKAGEYLNLNVPLDAEAKIGRNWAETH